MKVISLNLSLSSACGADCIFCPSDRGTSIKTKNMPFDLAERLVREAAAPEFRERFGTVHMEIGENGDAFINKEAVEILRMIKRTAPEFKVAVFTNFQNLTPDKLEDIISEGLISRIGLNIDGHNEHNFRAVKRISVKHINQNFAELLRLRHRHKSPIQLVVNVVTFAHYVSAVNYAFGRPPIRLNGMEIPDIPDDFEKIKAQILPALRASDSFGRSPPFFWAERPAFKPGDVTVENYSCPLITRVAQEAFIAPDGTWYACCFDSDNRLSLGNAGQQSLAEIADSEKRKQLVRDLAAKRFNQIGGPCATVNCCQNGLLEPM